MAPQDHKLPTAEEFFNLKAQEKGWEDFHHYLAFDSSHSDFETKLLLEWNKEFAKLHVEAALKEAIYNVEINNYDKSIKLSRPR